MVCVQILPTALLHQLEKYDSAFDAIMKYMCTATHAKNVSVL